MSDEIQMTMNVQFNKGDISETFNKLLTVDVAGDNFIRNVQTIGTSEETVVVGDVAAAGYVLVQNLDAANFIQLGISTGSYMIRVNAGEVVMFRLDTGSTIYAKADTAAVKALFFIIAN